MSQELTIDSKQIFSFTPSNLKEAMEYSKIIADSDLVPKDFKGKPGNVLVAVQMGMEIGLSPLQAIQNIAVINGRPSIYGDVGKALLLAAGCLIDEDDLPAVKAAKRGRCKITRPNGAVTERTFSIEDAAKAKLRGKSGPWTDYEDRMLMWRAFWFAARDGCADLLHGLRGAEEVADYIDAEASDVTAEKVTAMREELKASQPQQETVTEKPPTADNGIDPIAEAFANAETAIDVKKAWSKLSKDQMKAYEGVKDEAKARLGILNEP